MTIDANYFHEHLRRHPGIIRLAVEFEQLTPENHPDQVGRVSLKEEMIVEISSLIHRHHIPFILLAHSPGHGLKAVMLHLLAENGNVDHLDLVEIVAKGTEAGQPGANLKWQVIRAYRNLHIRFPDEPQIAISAANILSILSDGADAALLAGIASMKEKLGIA